MLQTDGQMAEWLDGWMDRQTSNAIVTDWLLAAEVADRVLAAKATNNEDSCGVACLDDIC